MTSDVFFFPMSLYFSFTCPWFATLSTRNQIIIQCVLFHMSLYFSFICPCFSTLSTRDRIFLRRVLSSYVSLLLFSLYILFHIVHMWPDFSTHECSCVSSTYWLTCIHYHKHHTTKFLSMMCSCLIWVLSLLTFIKQLSQTLHEFGFNISMNFLLWTLIFLLCIMVLLHILHD